MSKAIKSIKVMPKKAPGAIKTISGDAPKKKPGVVVKPIKKAVEETPAVTVEETPELEVNVTPVAEEVQETLEMGLPVEEPKTEEEPEVVTEQVNLLEEVQEEIVVEEVKEETVVEEVKEEPKKKTSRSKKKKEVAVEESQNSEVNSDNTCVFNTINDVIINNVPFEEVDNYMKSIVVPVTDKWLEEKTIISNQLKAIAIDSEMDPGTCKEKLQLLDSLSTDAYGRYMEYKAQYDNLVGKDGIIDIIKNMNSQGSNAEQRKSNSIVACLNYKDDGRKQGVNLFQYSYAARDKYYFYEGIIKQIEFKKQLLITFNGMLKIENSY